MYTAYTQNVMKIILLSGGSGKRLWPLSNDVRSKQFLKLLRSPGGKRESMIQRMVRQLKDTGLDEIIVSTSLKQKQLIREQLGELQRLVIEPARRDTFPAIYLACLYLHSQGTPSDETVIVLPCDSYASDEYYSSVHKIAEMVEQHAGHIILMGIVPTYPSSKYGYILPCQSDNPSSELRYVRAFVEKPDPETAAALIDEGALWNGGVHGFTLGYLLKLGKDYFGMDEYNTLLEHYAELPKTGFSYEVLEKAKDIAVIPFTGLWSDIGTWNSLTDYVQPEQSDSVVAEDCHDTFIINESDLPMLCKGCDDMIIVASKEGILVTDKENSENIKSLVERLEANYPLKITGNK